MNASARYRRKHRERGSLFDTHPSPNSRMADLRISANEVTVPGKTYDTGHARYLKTIAPIRQMLLEDQVKLNDPGGSQYLLNTLALDGWNGTSPLLRGRGLAAAQSRRRRGPRSTKLCRRRRLSRRSAGSMALARPRTHQAGSQRRGEGGPRPLSQDEADGSRRALHPSDDRLGWKQCEVQVGAGRGRPSSRSL